MKKEVILAAIIFIFANLILISAQAPVIITVTPGSGFSATTISGNGFAPGANVIILWDGGAVPSVPSPLAVNGAGSFTAIISVPSQTSVGSHVITASDGASQSSSNFVVVNVTGPPGPQGTKGEKGEQGPAGIQGTQGEKGELGVSAEQPESSSETLILSISISAISLAMATIALVLALKKKK